MSPDVVAETCAATSAAIAAAAALGRLEVPGMFGGGFFGGGFGGGVPGRFDHPYQAYPVSFLGKEDLEKGNKMILPQSALDHLARLNISYPMLFEVNNESTGRRTHAGVQEFIAEEGMFGYVYAASFGGMSGRAGRERTPEKAAGVGLAELGLDEKRCHVHRFMRRSRNWRS